MEEAKQVASEADAVIIFAGLPDRYESEGFDRKHLHMPSNQNQLIEAITAVQSNVVVVLMNGSPIDMPWVGRVKSILEAYLGGQAAGGAIADLLFGEVNPSGKLTETFPMKLSDNPSFLFFPGEGIRAELGAEALKRARVIGRIEIDVVVAGHIQPRRVQRLIDFLDFSMQA